jgi:hypothetical protein
VLVTRERAVEMLQSGDCQGSPWPVSAASCVISRALAADAPAPKGHASGFDISLVVNSVG